MLVILINKEVLMIMIETITPMMTTMKNNSHNSTLDHTLEIVKVTNDSTIKLIAQTQLKIHLKRNKIQKVVMVDNYNSIIKINSGIKES